MKAMRDIGWTRNLRKWPPNETLLRASSRDLMRVGTLLEVLKYAVQNHGSAVQTEEGELEDDDEGPLLAPKNWLFKDVMVCNTSYAPLRLRALEQQRQVLQDWTPETAVPPFSIAKAAGSPGVWNYTQPNETKGTNKETRPFIVRAQPEPGMFDEFLRIRTTEDGSTLRDLFHEPVTREDGKILYPFKQIRAHDLPTRSERGIRVPK